MTALPERLPRPPAPGSSLRRRDRLRLFTGRPGWDGIAATLPFLLPAVALYAAVTLFPIVETLRLSVTAADTGAGARAALGIENYAKLAADPIFWRALRQTILWLVLHLVGAGGTGFVLALAVSRLAIGRTFFRCGFFLPHVVSIGVVAVIWGRIYDPYFGLINGALQSWGLDALARGWLSEPFLVLFSVNLASSWHGFGFYMLLFIAGLQGIDRTLYDAAEVDGASAFQKFIHVTLPGLRQVITFAVSLALIGGLQGFATVWVMTRGGPFYRSELLTTYIYRLAFQMQDHGRAAALCVVLSLMAIAIAIGFNRWRERAG